VSRFAMSGTYELQEISGVELVNNKRLPRRH
jgi:hypothetical protein